MDTKEYLALQVERTRGQLRATSFLQLPKNTVVLQGKVLSTLLADLQGLGSKPIELIYAAGRTQDREEAELPGDVVSQDNAFLTNEGMLWSGTDICFCTKDGAVVSPDQMEYLTQNELGPAQIFGAPMQPQLSFPSVWKTLTRIAREARSDKAKEVLYLTVGSVQWEINGQRGKKTVCSPLFLLPVREERTGKGVYKLKLLSPFFRQNSVLKREMLKETAISLYAGCGENIPIAALEQAILSAEASVKDYPGGMRIDKNTFALCILDSHDESICQAVEKNLDRIAASPLAQILAGDRAAQAVPPSETVPIFPLPADESQRRVITRVMDGESIYATAPAGTGKSQTSVNIAANLALQGKTVCIMSEKRAANEVFFNYAAAIGLDKYCLRVDSTTKTAEIVKQIKAILKVRRQYVCPQEAKETLERYREAVASYERLNHELYGVDPMTGLSLYDLIAKAVEVGALPYPEGITTEKKQYAQGRKRLQQLRSECFDTMDDTEFSDYFASGSTQDPELDAMLAQRLQELLACGIDLSRLVKENHLNRQNCVSEIEGNLARRLAGQSIGDGDLSEVGNRHIKAIYKNLAETQLQMEQLYAAILKQELSARVEAQTNSDFLGILEKLRTTKITPQELFSVHGEEILSICPILITTPTAAANYLYNTGSDQFGALIIDEASQMSIISILPYLDRTEQLVVFGDHMQLGITSLFMKKDLLEEQVGIQDSAYVDRSVLQAVQGRLPNSPLSYHYRSRTEMLIHVSNKTCYDGALQAVPDIYTHRRALPPHLGLEVVQVAPPDPDTERNPRENRPEAEEIVSRVQALLSDHPDRSVGIIAFNEPQQELIADLLDERVRSYTDDDRLWVRSLENAQGKEADVIFVSIGHHRRTKEGNLYLGISEINRVGGENRLNVLFTRARCKNVIVLSFDYHELKKSDNPGVKRLYEYLDYAVCGELNETVGIRQNNADHAMIRSISALVEAAGKDYKASPRIGSEQLSVDIAVRKEGEEQYALGLLLPSFGQSAQETMTKLSVLERAGWHLAPLSPIYFLISPGLFAAQLKREITRHTAFSRAPKKNFETDRPPQVPFALRQLGIRYDSEIEANLTALTEDDFLAIDFEAVYQGVIDASLWDKDDRTLNELTKQGNTEANLLLLLRLRQKWYREGKQKNLMAQVNRLYAVLREPKASFLFAQLLRVGGIGNNGPLIANLFKEAYLLGIGGE